MEDPARKTARGRSSETPARAMTGVFAVVFAVFLVVVTAALLLYFFT